ncbi:hypothetical protein, conserved [Plasmodium gonderi]|uniref:Uncharacterized protein n=1 Tax=Plasmodium gonderi TaxID=77519 RepID=A0A1Y1JIE7_PLAGO|nr:hypothetical protein, conserved [Plasmodium gonderi]GAW81145.1 hypothetical protein, conserved [Plasmodium gonderi]
MTNEKKKIVSNVFYQFHGKLMLYIRIKQSLINHSEVSRKVKELEECYKKYVNSNSTQFRQLKFCYHCDDNKNEEFGEYTEFPNCSGCPECSSENQINKDIVHHLLNNYIENNNGCVVSFFTNEENSHICKNSRQRNKRNIPSGNERDMQIKNLVNKFFIKINEVTLNKNNQNNYSLQYGFFDSISSYDLLEKYCEHREYYQKIKSCTLKSDEKKVKGKIDNKRFNKKNIPPKSELKKFIQKTNSVEFSDSKKLNDILNFAEKQEKVIMHKLNRKECLFCTIISIHINNAKEGEVLMQRFMTHNTNDKSKGSTFFFVKIYYKNDNKENERGEKGTEDGDMVMLDKLEQLNSVFTQFSILLSQPHKENSPPLGFSIYNKVTKIIYEICCNFDLIHLNVTLHTLDDSNVNEMDKPIFNFLSSVDSPLEKFLKMFIKCIKRSKILTYSLGENCESGKNSDSFKNSKSLQNQNMAPKSETQAKIENILFDNIDLDEKTKCIMTKEAMNFPEQHLNKLALLNKTFQHNCKFFKKKEKEIHTSFTSIVEKQNEIMKHYEEEERQQKNDINRILKEISYINDQNIEIQNEIEKHKKFNFKYGHIEKNRQEEQSKKFQYVDSVLDREFESLLKFRQESLVNNNFIGKWDTKQDEETAKVVEENKREELKTYNIISQNDIQDIRKKKEEEYSKNLNEVMNHAKKMFRETQDMRKRYDEVIRQNTKLFSILKDTAIKFNEKANYLMNNFQGADGLKLINPIEDKCVDFMEKYECPNLIINNDMKEYNALLEELKTRNFNERQLRWIHKMSSLSKNF